MSELDPTGRPQVQVLRHEPRELVSYAAGACYGRDALREPAKETALIGWLGQQDPPHLTCYEHARFNVRVSGLPEHCRDVLLESAASPLYRRNSSVMGFNASQLWKLRHWPDFAPILVAVAPHFPELVNRQEPPRPLVKAEPWQGAHLPRNPFTELPAGAYCSVAPEMRLSDYERHFFPNRSFEIIVSRVASHQIVRHRSVAEGSDDDVSIEQASQRYMKRAPFPYGTVWPVAMAPHQHVEVGAELDAFEQDIIAGHAAWTARGFHREDVRYFAPGATATRLILTAPLGRDVRSLPPGVAPEHRGWYHFCRLRCHRKAQAEVRFVATLVHRTLVAEFPETFSDITPEVDDLADWLD